MVWDEEEVGDVDLSVVAPTWRGVCPIIALDVGLRVVAAGEADRPLGVGEIGFFAEDGDVDRAVGERGRLWLALGLPRISETHSMYRDTHWSVKPSILCRTPRTSVAVL